MRRKRMDQRGRWHNPTSVSGVAAMALCLREDNVGPSHRVHSLGEVANSVDIAGCGDVPTKEIFGLLLLATSASTFPTTNKATPRSKKHITLV